MTCLRSTIFRLALSTSVLISGGQALAQVAVPDTPAGHTLQAWLSAFNSGDPKQLGNYVKTIDPSENVDGMLAFHNGTGGFNLLSVVSSEPLHISFRLQEKNSATNAFGNLFVKDGQPPTVSTFAMRPLPPGVVPLAIKLDAAMRERVIGDVDTALREYYVHPTVAQGMIDALATHQRAGDYNTITDGDLFATRLQADMRAVSHDGHLHMEFSPYNRPNEEGPSPAERERFQQAMLHDNCAFDKAEILPGNIGYLKFNAFQPVDFCKPTVIAAMGFVAHADALIVDLRENGGGDPAMVSFIASYLFSKPTHLNDLYNRHENHTQEYWTAADVPGTRLDKQPVYVLTSHGTFSGAEEFSYDMKTQKRATIVGETTGGGAHPVSGHLIAEYFDLGVPFADAINPITKTSWEGTGVEPDVKVPASEALATAEKLAERKLHRQ